MMDDPVAVAEARDFFGDGLRAEMRACFADLSAADRSALIELGIAAEDIDRFRLCGRESAVIEKNLYQPIDGGAKVFVSPVRVDLPNSPESSHPLVYVRRGRIVDLVAWHPSDPEQWALRRGAAEWLGCIEPQYLDPDPVRVHRSVLGWLQSGCVGLVPLADDPASIYRVLCWCQGGIIADDEEHRYELRRALNRPWPHPRIQVVRDAA